MLAFFLFCSYNTLTASLKSKETHWAITKFHIETSSFAKTEFFHLKKEKNYSRCFCVCVRSIRFYTYPHQIWRLNMNAWILYNFLLRWMVAVKIASFVRGGWFILSIWWNENISDIYGTQGALFKQSFLRENLLYCIKETKTQSLFHKKQFCGSYCTQTRWHHEDVFLKSRLEQSIIIVMNYSTFGEWNFWAL